MLVKCLENLVGLKGSCDCSNPTSGLFVNSLPRVSLKNFAALADEEKIRGEELFKELHDEAVIEVLSLFRSKLKKHFEFKKVLQRKTFGKAGGCFEKVNQKGIQISKTFDNCYQSLYIEKVSFRAKKAVSGTIAIEDNFGKTEQKVNVKAGLNNIRLDYETLESSVVTFSKNICIANSIDCGCGGNCGCSPCADFDIRQIECIKGEWKQQGSGICISAYVKCSDEDLICTFKNELAMPIRLMIGIKLMQDAATSDEIHPFVRNGKEDAEKLLTIWMGGIDKVTGFEHKSKFWQLLTPVCEQAAQYLESVKNPCVKCNSSVEYIERIG